MSRIFLSHSSANNAEAVALRDWLAHEGWKDEIFLDLDPQRGIAAGERWERALNAAASRCEAVLFLVSKAWLASRWCLKEFNLAHRLNKRLFGVLIEDLTVADLPADLAGTWQIVRLATGRDHVILWAVLPVTHDEVHVTFSAEGLLRLKHGLEEAGLDPKFFAWPPSSDPNRPPYRGLRPIEAEDAGIFFGRDAPIVEALDRLRGLREAAPPRLLVILGASGAGKSSFLRAGLLPRLARDDRHFLPLPILRPERAALFGETGLLHALEAAFQAAGIAAARAKLRAAIEAGASTLRPLLQALVDKAMPSAPDAETNGKPPTLILSIDQGEELFLPEGQEEAQALLTLLRDLLLEDAPALIVDVAIRSDSYSHLQEAKPLDGIRKIPFDLGPMPKGAYAEVIKGPPRRLEETPRKLIIEEALIEALLADIEAGGSRDALPLLAFTLERLYVEHGGDGDLTLAKYRSLGGIKGSIEAAIERVFTAANADPAIPKDRMARLALLRRGLIPWLAGIDPDTGAPRRRVARRSEIPAGSWPLIKQVVEQRLLATDVAKETGEITIEPAHEALLRQWDLLAAWLAEDAGLLAVLEGVKRASRDWAANGKSTAWLTHTAGRLEAAEHLSARPDLAANLEPTDRAYLGQCAAKEAAAREEAEAYRRAREDDQARQLADARKLAWRTGIGLAAALILLVVAGWQYWDANQQKRVAQEQTKIAEAQKQRAENDFGAAKQAVDGLIFNIAQGFEDVSGMPVATIRQILDTVKVTINTLAASEPGDKDLQSSRMAMLNNFVRIYLKAGDLADAETAAEQGLAIAREFANDKGNAEAQRDLSVSLNLVGNVKVETGDLKGALAAYEEWLVIARELARDKGNAQAQADLAVSLNKIGDMKLRAGELKGALAAYEEELAIDRELAKDKRNAEAQSDLGLSLDRIGDAKLRAGDSAGALAAYEESLAIARVLAEDRGNAVAQRVLAISLDKIGDVKLQAGDQAGALAAYGEGLAIRRELAKDTGNAKAQRDLSASLDKIGDVKLAAEDRAGALAAYEESLAIRRALAKDKGNAQAQTDVVVSLTQVAQVVPDPGPLYQEALAILEALDAQGQLTKEQQGWIDWVKGKIAGLKPKPP